MASPFPGMDPYLESHWGDVHTSLITYARDQLRVQLPADLRVRVEEHVAVEAESGERHGFYPDVRVIERPGGLSDQSAAATTMAIAEPLVVPMQIEAETQRSLQIIDSSSGNRIVTAIEILSPANKLGEAGRQAYRRKQRDMLAGGVNLVEIDLLREGLYVMAVPARAVPRTHLAPYRICVVRASNPEWAEVYPTSLRQRLCTIKVPLRPADADVQLDLQSLIDRSYENGGYEDIDYRIDPFPPLQGDDAVWADEWLRAKRRR